MGCDQFWKKWMSAGELERLDLIKSLFKKSRFCKDDVDVHAIGSLVNSYLEDLEEYINKGGPEK